MVSRRGSVFSGCLTLILVTAIFIFVATHVGRPYYRYYQFRDAVQQQARFATVRSDTVIQRALWATADSLELPEEAFHIRIARSPRAIRIWTMYTDHWVVGSYTRPVYFDIDVEHAL